MSKKVPEAKRTEAKGVVGYIGRRRVKGAFVLKDIVTDRTVLEVTPRKLHRLARLVQGRMIQREEARIFLWRS